MTTQTHYLGHGDEGPSVSRQALLGGEPMALTGTPTFTLWPLNSSTPVSDYNATPAVMVDTAAGRVRFDWPSPTTLPRGKYLARFRALNAAGDEVSIPNSGHIVVLVT